LYYFLCRELFRWSIEDPPPSLELFRILGLALPRALSLFLRLPPFFFFIEEERIYYSRFGSAFCY